MVAPTGRAVVVSPPPRRLAIIAPLSVRAGKAFSIALRFDRRATRQAVTVQIRSGHRWTALVTRRVSGVAPIVRATIRTPGRRIVRVVWRAGGSLHASAPTVVLVRAARR